MSALKRKRSQCSTSKLLWQKAIWMLVRIT
jgi:hypothetical protein